MEKFLRSMLEKIIANPDNLSINETVDEKNTTKIYHIGADESDLGKIIGKEGNNISAIRRIMTAATQNENGYKTIIVIDRG